MTKDKLSSRGIKFSIMAMFILTLFVVSLIQLYLSIETTTTISQNFFESEKVSQKSVYALISQLARDQAGNVDQSMRKLAHFSSMLAREAKFYLERIDVYGEIARVPEEKLTSLGNGIFTGSSAQIAGVNFWGESISSMNREQLNALSYLDPSLMSVVNENREISAGYIYTEFNIHRYYPNAGYLPRTLSEYDLRRESLYAMAAPANNLERKTVWTNPYRDPSGKLLITASTPIYCNKKFIGIAAVDVVLEYLLPTPLENLDMQFCIIDKRGNIIAYSAKFHTLLALPKQRHNLFTSTSPEIQKAAKVAFEQDSIVTELHLEKLPYLFCSSTLPNTGWKIFVAVPKQPLHSSREERMVLNSALVSMAVKFSLTTFSLLLLLLIASKFFLHKYLLCPLRELTEAAEKIRNGNLLAKVSVFRQDEVGAFACAFNDMVEGLQRSKKKQKNYTKRLECKVGNSTREITIKDYKLEDTLSTLKNEIVERIAAEKKLKISKEKAEAATHAKSQFLANMSHEIRTPMNAILGFAELLESKIENEQEKQYLASIRSSGKTLLGIINDILDLSKIEAGKLEFQYESVSIRAIFKEIGQIFSHQANEKELSFQINIIDSLPQFLMLDEIRLRQILLNLVGNAMKFTKSGYVKLSARCLKGKTNTVELILSVKDTGIGIPKDQTELIFEAFRQQEGQKATYGGTGLGLAITKRLVEMMGGKISVDSTINRGSKFHVFLKNVEIAPSRSLIDTEENIRAIAFNKALILIVDDIEYNRELLKGFLDFPAIELIEAKNGREAIDLARLYKPELILMDMKMPIIDGYQAMRIIRKDAKIALIPVIAVTASVMKEDEDLVKSVGCNGFLRKPVSRKKLLTEVKHFIAHSFPENEAPKQEHHDSIAKEILSAESRSKIPQLLQILRGDMYERWYSTCQTFIVDNIEEFANEIKLLAKDYQLSLLENWAKTLARQAKNFDIERLPKTLDSFPDMLKAIEELL